MGASVLAWKTSIMDTWDLTGVHLSGLIQRGARTPNVVAEGHRRRIGT